MGGGGSAQALQAPTKYVVKAGKAEASAPKPAAFLLQEFLVGTLDAADPVQKAGLTKLEATLAFVTSLPRGLIRLIECRTTDSSESLVPSLLPESFSGEIEVIANPKSAAAALAGHNVVVCGTELERLIYTVYELKAAGCGVCVLPGICPVSNRSGCPARTSLISHMEEVLGATVLFSAKNAFKWLISSGWSGPPMPAAVAAQCASAGWAIAVVSKDNTVLDETQEAIVRILFGGANTAVSLKKLGKGWSAALKFFCAPTTIIDGSEAVGALTFLKIGPEEEMAAELDITQRMMRLLGNFCPQVLGYAELGDSAGLHLTLANMGEGGPRGFADLYESLLAAAGSGNADEVAALTGRLDGAISNVFGTLLPPMHKAISGRVPLSLADSLGLCCDVEGGMKGDEASNLMASGWVLEKITRKWGGDGKLASSVKKTLAKWVGDAEAAKATVSFGVGAEFANVAALLDDAALMTKLKQARTPLDFSVVHGDLHGDNIMIDSKDNRYLIDFGKTRGGHALEDVTWLEAFCLLKYVHDFSDDEYADALKLVPALAGGFSVDGCALATLDGSLGGTLTQPRVIAMWAIVKALRAKLGDFLAGSDLPHEAALVGRMLSLRNCLFLAAAPLDADEPNVRKLALALACAYSEGVRATVA